MEKLEIISVNVRGHNCVEKRTKLYDWLTDTNLKVDIIFLQETHYIEKNELRYNSRWFGKSIHNFSDSVYSRGVSILFRKDLNIEIINVHKYVDARKLLVNVRYDENVFTFVNVYAPNNDNDRVIFFKKLKTFISRNTLNENDILLCGDFNCCKGRIYDKSYMKLLDTVRCLDLTDVWIDKHPQLNGYTWCNANDIPTSRIDYMFLSNEFMYKMDKILIRRVPGTHSNGTRMTDHRLLKLFIVVSEDKRGPGYWKLNVSYLDHEDYRKGIEHIVENLDETLSALEKWECFKRKVKDFSIYFARNTKKKTGLLIRQIENEISTLEDDPNIECNMNRKRLLEAQLDTLCNVKAKGAQIRSRYKWVTEGEKNTKYFLGLETKQQSYNVIREIKSDENGICTTQNDIMGEMCSFYEKLYTSKNINDVDIDDYLSNIEIPSLSSVDKEYCDEFPTLEECRDAVFNMKPNKSPGLD